MYRSFIVLVFIFCFCPNLVWAQSNNLSKTDKVNEVSVFNKVTDYFTTLGKSNVQKAATLQKRKEQRRIRRLQSLQLKKEEEQRKKQEKIVSDMKKVKGL